MKKVYLLLFVISYREELSASESLRERGCLYGNPHNLEFLPLMAVEVYANDGVQYVSTDPTVQYITAGKDMSEAWDPVIAYSRMNMAQQVLLVRCWRVLITLHALLVF